MRIDIRLSAIPKVGYMYCILKEVSIWCRGLEMALLQEIRRLRALLEEREIAAAARAAEMQARMDQLNEAAQREMQAIDRMELLLGPMHLMRLAADGLRCLPDEQAKHPHMGDLQGSSASASMAHAACSQAF